MAILHKSFLIFIVCIVILCVCIDMIMYPFRKDHLWDMRSYILPSIIKDLQNDITIHLTPENISPAKERRRVIAWHLKRFLKNTENK